MTTLKEALKGKLTPKQLEQLRGGFDVVGDIAVIEVARSLQKKQKLIAKTLLDLLPNVKVVAAKQGGHLGKYRRQKLIVLAGEKRLETTHKESGVMLALNVQDCYYSPRLGTERLRIARMITKPERILVAGSGIAPYPLVIGKHSPAREITAVEVNPIAHRYALANVISNKMQNKITCLKGDVTKLKLGTFDRIIANIPHKGIVLMPSLLKFAKKGTIIHVYDFASQAELDAPAMNIINLCSKYKKKCTILHTQKTGQHAVRSYRVCIDVKIQ